MQIVLQLGILSTLRRRDLAFWLLFKINFINAVGNTTGEASVSTGDSSSPKNDRVNAGADPEILKRGVLYVGHHGWPTKKILGFKWSKKAKIMLETKAFGETFLSAFSNFL